MATTPKGITDNITWFTENYVVFPFMEACLTAPLMLTVGSAFFAFLALNLPLFFVALSSMEALTLYNLFGQGAGFLATPTTIVNSKPGQVPDQCVSKFNTTNGYRFRFFLSEGLSADVLNKPLYFLSFITAYLSTAMYQFIPEFTRLGSAYEGRPMTAPISAAVITGIFLLFLYTKGCTSFFGGAASLLIGLLIGVLIAYQNILIFGRSSVNVAFVPELSRRGTQNQDYICVTKKT